MTWYSYKCGGCNQVQDLEFPMGKAPDTIWLPCDGCSPNYALEHRRLWVFAGVVFRGGGWGGRPEHRPPSNTVSLKHAKEKLGYRGVEPW